MKSKQELIKSKEYWVETLDSMDFAKLSNNERADSILKQLSKVRISKLKPTPEEVVSAKEYLEQFKIPCDNTYGLYSKDGQGIEFEDLLAGFNHTRIEHAKKANAELMEEVVKVRSCLEDACIGMEWMISENIPSIGKADYEKLEEWRKVLSQSGTPEAYQKQDELLTYDTLECPTCDKKCHPDAIRRNGTVVYEVHRCKGAFDAFPTNEHFEIDIEGNLVE